jgi:small subunit ribosomal protein S20
LLQGFPKGIPATKKKEKMANHKSSIKRIRSNDAKRLRNRYQAKTMRNAIKELRADESKKSASEKLPKVIAMVDKLAKKSVIHKNKASNLKSKLTKKVNALTK